MKTIIALLKNAEKSERFMRYTYKLAEAFNMDIKFLHCVISETYPLATEGSYGGVVAQVQTSVRSLIDADRKKIAKKLDAIQIDFANNFRSELFVENAHASYSIQRHVDKIENTMILVEEAMDNDRQYATVLDIINSFNCPVWVIPEEADFVPLKNIVYATDYNPKDAFIMRRLIRLTKMFLPEITALHVFENEDYSEKLMCAGFNDLLKNQTNYGKVKVKAISEMGNEHLADTLNNYTTLLKANLLVVLKENHNFLTRLFKASSTKKILKKTRLPVLVFHEPN